MNKRYCIWLLSSIYLTLQLNSQSVYTSTSRDQVFSLNIDGGLDALNKGDAELYLQRCNSIARAGINFDVDDIGASNVLRSSWFMGIDGDQHFRIKWDTRNGLTGLTTGVDVLYVDADDNDDLIYDDPAIILPSNSKLEFFSFIQNNDLSGSSLGIEINSNNFIPEVDNFTSLGLDNFRYVEVHAAGGLITTSDRRLKNNIHPMPYGLQDLLKLTPVSYTWKSDANKKTKVGLLAQEVNVILPEIVRYKENTESDYSINYTGLVPVLIKSIQDQQLQIEQLRVLIAKAKKYDKE